MNINEMTREQVVETIRIAHQLDGLLDEPTPLGDILRQLSERVEALTRWIPIAERLPTKEDADKHGYVIIREVENESPKRMYHALVKWSDVLRPNYFYTVTHWRRIDKPEGV